MKACHKQKLDEIGERSQEVPVEAHPQNEKIIPKGVWPRWTGKQTRRWGQKQDATRRMGQERGWSEGSSGPRGGENCQAVKEWSGKKMIRSDKVAWWAKARQPSPRDEAAGLACHPPKCARWSEPDGGSSHEDLAVANQNALVRKACEMYALGTSPEVVASSAP